MDESQQTAVVARYLRRKYASDRVGLQKLIDEIAANGALDAVTLTGSAFEGDSKQGQLTFHPLAYLDSAMTVLAELEEAVGLTPPSTPPIGGALMDYSCRPVET